MRRTGGKSLVQADRSGARVGHRDQVSPTEELPSKFGAKFCLWCRRAVLRRLLVRGGHGTVAVGVKRPRCGRCRREVQALRCRMSQMVVAVARRVGRCRSARRGWCKRVTSRLLSAQRGLLAVAVSAKRIPCNRGEPEMYDFTSLSLRGC